MADFAEYIVSQLKSKRLSKEDALALIKQYSLRTPAAPQSFKIHPLLHANTSNLDRQRYRVSLTGNEFFLGDHRLNEQKILPAVVYLEMARAAAEDAIPVKPALSVLELRNVAWAHPIIVEDQKEISIALFLNEAGAKIDFEIYSGSDAGNEIVHCQGQAAFVPDPALPKADLAQLKAQMKNGELTADGIYAVFKEMGADFGPAHRGIRQLLQGDRQVLSALTLPAAAGPDWNRYQLHPSVMDGALQSSIGLAGDLDKLVDPKPSLPFSLESLRVIGACTREMFAWLRYAPGGGPQDRLEKLDIDLFDEQGNICVQLKGYSSRSIATGERGRPIQAEQYGTLLAAPVWEPADTARPNDEPLNEATLNKASLTEVPPDEARNKLVQRHIILCDLPDTVARQVGSSFPGVTCHLLPAAGKEDVSERFRYYAAACFEKLRSLMGAKLFVQIAFPGNRDETMLAGLAGLLQTANLENPGFAGQLLFTDNPDLLAEQLLREQHSRQDLIVCYEQGSRKVLRWQLVADAEGEPPVPFKEQGVYLITGGLGGLGVLFAKEILRHTPRSRIILAGRSHPAGLKDKQPVLAELQAAGSNVEYRQLDMDKPAGVKQFIAAVLKDYQHINGILHCAGLTADNYILKKTNAEFDRVLAPKVTGTFNLDTACQELDLDFFVLFSSVVSAFGNAGQADYAAANGFMDQFTAYRNKLAAAGQRRGKTLAINWPLWQDGGMKPGTAIENMLAQTTGMHPMKTVNGMRAFYRGLELPYNRILVMEGNLPQLKSLIAGRTRQSEKLPPSETQVYTGDLRKKTREYLIRQVSEVLKLPAHRIDAHDPMEKYGIDSILAMNLTNQLEKVFGSLPKTLFFEYQTIHELTGYFVRSCPELLTSLFTKKQGGGLPRTLAPESVAEAAPEANAAAVPRIQTRRLPTGRISRELQNQSGDKAGPIAIVGLSGRYPEALNTQAYWQNLREGKDCIIEIPKERWDWREFYSEDRDKSGYHYSKWGGFISGVDEFDPRFFNISPREAQFIDPQERLFLQHAWMAVEDAGYNRAALQQPHDTGLAGQVGVYVGLMYSEYQLFGLGAGMKRQRLSIAGSYASIANRVSYVLNLHGPSMTLDTMCSSSLTAVHLACQDLKQGRTNLAIAGGVNVSIHPNKYLFLSAGQFVSTDGHCQSFGEGGDGYIPGEGVGVVVLKRLPDALLEGNHIYGIIKGSAINHGGKTNGYSVPNPSAQASAISTALAESKINARHISYIEAHGTGTKLGDPIEIAALSKAFQRYTQDTGFCLIGSAKSNIGHCESAAGVAGLTKVLLQMKYRKIVPSLHSGVLNPYIDFQKTPFIVNQTLRDWDRPVIDGEPIPRIAGISAFGAGGANAHLIVEEYLPAERSGRQAVSIQPDAEVIVPLSARTAGQLKQKATDLLDFIQADPPGLAAMAYTLQVGREALEERAGFIVNSTGQLIKKLQAYLQDGQNMENVFQGQVSRNKNILSLISADNDFEDTLDKWLTGKKLAKITELWVNGLELDWNKLYGPVKPPRVSLPAYPFARERYWIDLQDQDTVATAGLTAAGKATTVLHPLLHTNISNFDQQRFRSRFSGEESFFKDHLVGTGKGQPQKMLPPSALLEMARAAVEQAAAARVEPGSLELFNVKWGQPVFAAACGQIDVVLFAGEENQIGFEIFSGEGPDEIVHCLGEAAYSTGPAAGSVDLDRLSEQTGHDRIDTAQIYPVLSASGLHYGPAYQGIVSINSGEKQLLAQLRLPAAANTSHDDHDLYPVLLESAVQAAVGLVSGLKQVPGQPFLPLALSRASLLSDCEKEMYAWVRYAKENDPDRKEPQLDIDLFDRQGKICVRLKGLALRQMTSDEEITAEPSRKPKAVQLKDSWEAGAAFSDTATFKPQSIQLNASPGEIVHKEITAGRPSFSLNKPEETAAAVNGIPAVPPDAARTDFTAEQLQAQLRNSLAEALYLDRSEIDVDKPFVDLGLDSIVGVEWTKMINKQYGLEIAATKVYDYPDIRLFSAFLHKEMQQGGRQRESPPLQQPAPVRESAPVQQSAQLQQPLPLPSAPVQSGAGHIADISKPPVFPEKKPFQRPASFPVLKRRLHREQTARTREKIAIIGMSGRYPQAKNMQEYWDNLARGRNAIAEIPASRWDINQYYDPDPAKEGKMYCKWLGALDEVDCFDPLFFQITPAEAEFMDPQHRLFLEESYKAFEDAGYPGAALSNTRCGVYLGIMSNDYSYLISKNNSSSVNITGNSFAIGAARIAYFLNLKGPAIPVDTACSSSLVAVHMACQGLLNNETDMALAGGVSLYLAPEGYIGMCQAGMLSPEGQCKAFDDMANGFVPGEGVGTLVLKRLKDAERDNDFIYGVILASGINQDGKTNGITAPSVKSQIELERELYARYAIDPESISYVEAHGTGTKLGDPIELEALATVFKEKTGKKNFCALGSVKSNIGHTSGAAGVASIQKVLLSMQHQTLVPTLNVTRENAIFDFKNSPFYISREKHAWNSNGSPRRASVSSFGFSGTNAHLIIEEYPPKAKQKPPVSPNAPAANLELIIPLSARTAGQLNQRANDLLTFIRRNEQSIDLTEMAYTLQVGRDAMSERLSLVTSSVVQLKEKLELYLEGTPQVAGVYRGRARSDKDQEGESGAGSVSGTAAGVQARANTGAQPGAINAVQPRAGQPVSAKELYGIAGTWAAGQNIDWKQLYGEHPPRRMSLPTYPFEKERYWAAARPAPHVVAEAGENLRKMSYRPEWKTAAPAVLPDGPLDETSSLTGPILVVDTSDELYQAIKEKLEGASQERLLTLVKLENAFRQITPDIFTIDPRQEPHFYQLLEALKATDRLPCQVIHQGARPGQPDKDQQLGQQLDDGFYTLFYLCKALISRKYQPRLEILSAFTSRGNVSAPSQAALGGFFKTLMLENPNYLAKLVEIQADRQHPAVTGPEKASIILDEFRQGNWNQVEIRRQVRNGRADGRYVKILTPFERKINQMPLKQNGVYLISGGLGGLGLIFAEHLARNFQCKLVLFGRSALNAGQEETLRRLQAGKAEILYLQADVSKLEDMETVVKLAKSRFSAINGVIHSAGVNKDAYILKKSRDEIEKVLRPKIYGALNLDNATKNEKLDLFVLFSSIAGVMGNPGQCDYAFGNRFLDAFAESRESLVKMQKRFGRTLSVNWPYWEEGGMNLDPAQLSLAKTQTGCYPLPTKEGIQYWEEFLQSGLSQCAAFFGLPTAIDAYVRQKEQVTSDEGQYAGINTTDIANLEEKTESYLKTVIGKEIKLAPERIDSLERFEAFGIDSIVINQLNFSLEKDLGALPKTLFYEYSTIEELTGYLIREAQPALNRFFNLANPLSEPFDKRETDKTHNHEDTGPIAIIGVHGRYPQSDNLDEYWENLKQGKDLTGIVPASRWNYEEFYDPDPENAANGKIYGKWGGFINDADKFDAHFFNIPPEEAMVMDPQERLFLESVWAAIEDAGYTKESLKKRYPKAKSADVGVFVGVTTNSYNLLAAGEWNKGQPLPGAQPWSIANRASYFFDFNGPSMPVDTACSSSLVAIHLACESLRKQECQLAVAGGVNLYLHPSKYHSFCKNKMLALHGKCRSYGAGDDGFVPGEGVGSVVLKPLSKAIADQDHIYAVIAGSRFDHSGRSNGYSAPNPNSQANLISETLRRSAIDPETIGYVEGHGTGTQLGDSLEIVALTNAFQQQTTKKQFCPVGSVKANIGHPESAAGIAGLTKILLQIKYRQLVPSIHSEEVNPAIEFKESPFYIQHGLNSWEPAPGTPRRALMNSFGAGGVNACIILEEFENTNGLKQPEEERPHLIILSAKTEERLREYADRLLAYIEKERQLNLADLSYTLQVGREAMQQRLAIVTTGRPALIEQLRAWRRHLPSDAVCQGTAAGLRADRKAREKADEALLSAAFTAGDLTRIARMWVEGADVEWANLYPQAKPARTALPTYPFKKERYWITDALIPGKITITEKGNGRLHPLVSYNSSSLHEVSFSSLLSDTEFYASDHQVNNEKVFPGSAFLEIAGISGNMAGGRKVCKISDIVWARPLSFKKGAQLIQTYLKPNGNGTEYQIASLDDENERIVHAEGRLYFQNGQKRGPAAEKSISIDALKEKCSEPLSGDHFYDLFRTAGFNYGPAFRTIREFYINGAYALSKLKIADNLQDDFEQFILHPSLLDGALQTVVGLMGEVEHARPYLPFAIDEVEILRPLPPTCYAYAAYAGDGKHDGAALRKFNIQLLNKDGLPLVRVTNFYARALDEPKNHAIKK